MSNLSKRSIVYFEPTIHQALKMRAASSQVSVSELIDEAVRLLMREDQEDLETISSLGTGIFTDPQARES